MTKVKLTGFQLDPPVLTVECDEWVMWTIGKNENQYSNIYKPGERYFILAIEELDLETEKLYTGHHFKHRFTDVGHYTLKCLNYPGIKQLVKVTLPWRLSQKGAKFSESRNGTEETSDNLKSPRDSSDKGKESSSLNSQDNQEGIAQISACLKMFVQGCTEEKMKEEFRPLFQPLRKSTFEYESEAIADMVNDEAIVSQQKRKSRLS